VEALPRLSAALKGPSLLVKRDDATGLAFGGNKTRKLECLLAEAQANGARTLVTAGAVQSNHCRQTAAAAARYGFDCILVLASQPDQTLASTLAPSANLMLDRLLGAELVWTERQHRDQTLRKVFETAWEEGRRPYLVPYGGSSATGASAYVLAFQELLSQGVQPDWIVFASSSGGTQAGLALGAKLAGYQGKVMGISIDEPENVLRSRVSELANATADLLGESARLRADEILVNDHFLGQGYGVAGEPEEEAIRLFARHEGLLLDPVYTGRAAAGLIALARSGAFAAGEQVCFWHTGGTPALFADAYRRLFE
jgi:D-cysteine desulfhydrase family pyridoxal phosphate-dependent enzyme